MYVFILMLIILNIAIYQESYALRPRICKILKGDLIKQILSLANINRRKRPLATPTSQTIPRICSDIRYAWILKIYCYLYVLQELTNHYKPTWPSIKQYLTGTTSMQTVILSDPPFTHSLITNANTTATTITAAAIITGNEISSSAKWTPKPSLTVLNISISFSINHFESWKKISLYVINQCFLCSYGSDIYGEIKKKGK